MCLFLNKFLIESKEYLIASSSLHVDLLASFMKLSCFLQIFNLVQFSLQTDARPVLLASE